MIIGINGYIGSGKDTVGEIIRYLISYRINGGNWSYPDGFKPNIQYTESKWEIKKYAAKLKQIASIMTGIPAEKFEDQEFKKTFLGKEWDTTKVDEIKKLPMSNDDFWNDTMTIEVQTTTVQMTVREFLQKLGTEAVRDSIHVNAWVNALMSDYKDVMNATTSDKGYKEWSSGVFPNWIITDCRFPNEAQAIKTRGGIVVRVNRRVEETYTDVNGVKTTIVIGPLDLHPSETSLDNWEFDYVIENNGTIEELTSEVKDMLKHFNLTD